MESITRWSFVFLAFLLIENVLGMALNLYVTLPTSPTFQQIFLSLPVLTLHIVVAFALVGLAAVALVRLHRAKIPRTVPWAVLALIGVVVALQEGFAFSFTQDPTFSYGMELGFLVGVGAEVLVLFRLSAARTMAAPEARTGGSPEGPPISA